MSGISAPFILRLSQETRFDAALSENLKLRQPSLSRRMLKDCFSRQKISSLELTRSDGEKRLVPLNDTLYAGTYTVSDSRWPEVLAALASQTDPVARPEPAGALFHPLFENDDLLVFNKPSGTPSLPLRAEETGTMVNHALAHRPELAGVGRGGLEPGLLHRLDTGTSGLLVFAKTEASFGRHKDIWQSGDVRKIYRARVRPSTRRQPLEIRTGQVIDLELAADPTSSKRMQPYSPAMKVAGAKPLPAKTTIEAIRSRGTAAGIPTELDLTVRITTGVRHQIRCHLASLGWPIIGDPIYGEQPSPRLWLHAWRLILPGGVEVEAPLPADWE